MDQMLMVSSALLWVIVLFNLLLTLVLIRRQGKMSGHPDLGSVSRHFETLPAGAKAPDFRAETLDGKVVTLKDFQGQKTAFVFIAPHCQPCKDKLPELEALHQASKSDDANIVLVIDADRATAQTLFEEFGITLRALAAPRQTNSFIPDYKTTVTPSYTLINRDSEVISAGLLGPNFHQELRQRQSMTKPLSASYSIQSQKAQ